MLATNRNIRQCCHLKYSKHGKFNWDKWTEYDCIFSSSINDNGSQQNQFELHSKQNIHESNGKIIDLKKLHSVTTMHDNTHKNEPNHIIILKIDGKKHRFGFNSIYTYNQWRSLLDGVYNSEWNTLNRNHDDENAIVNMHYESATALRYRVHFADLATTEILSLPNDVCELIFDRDKVVLEQHHVKQYIFPRSTIRTIYLINTNTIELELGSRAPVQGSIRFRFESPTDARLCYFQWIEDITRSEVFNQGSSEHFSTRINPQRMEYPPTPPRIPIQQQQHNYQPRRPRKDFTTQNPFYDTESSIPSTTNVLQNDYEMFYTLV